MPSCHKNSQVLDCSYLEKSYTTLHYLRFQRTRGIEAKIGGHWSTTMTRDQKDRDQVGS